MSDIESIESESFEVHSDNDSDVYRGYESDNQNNNDKKIDNKIIKRGDSYSNEYDDDFNESYSNDFDIDKSSISSTPIAKHKTVVNANNNTSKDNNKNTNKNINNNENVIKSNPETNLFNTIHTEIILDEISKEVLKLRDKQKNLLQQRKLLAIEKRNRAVDRRNKYMNQLTDLTNQLNNEQNINKQLNNDINILKQEINTNNNIISSLKVTNESLNNNINTLHNQQNDLSSSYNSEINVLKDEIIKLNEDKLKNNKVIDEYNKELLKYKLLNDIVDRSIVMNDIRLAKDREDIPSYQKRLIDEQFERLAMYESKLIIREESIKNEESQRLLYIEEMKKQTIEDLNKMRRRHDEDLTIERQRLEDYKNELDSIKYNNELLYNKQKNELLKYELDIKLFNQAIKEEKQKLLYDKLNYDIKISNVSNQLDIIDNNKLTIEQLLIDNEKINQQNITKQKELIQIEKAMREKTNFLDSEIDRYRQLHNKNVNTYEKYNQFVNRVNSSLQSLNNEKYDLYLYTNNIYNISNQLLDYIKKLLKSNHLQISNEITDQFDIKTTGKVNKSNSNSDNVTILPIIENIMNSLYNIFEHLSNKYPIKSNINISNNLSNDLNFDIENKDTTDSNNNSNHNNYEYIDKDKYIESNYKPIDMINIPVVMDSDNINYSLSNAVNTIQSYRNNENYDLLQDNRYDINISIQNSEKYTKQLYNLVNKFGL